MFRFTDAPPASSLALSATAAPFPEIQSFTVSLPTERFPWTQRGGCPFGTNLPCMDPRGLSRETGTQYGQTKGAVRA